jgi:hypothetical protein
MNFKSLRSAFGKTDPKAADLADGMGPAAWCRLALQKLYAAMGFRQFQGSYATKRVSAWVPPAPEPK